jgi:lipopolysaccharide biosynthesis regulator YciM
VTELLWLLLPVAALSGWFVARRVGECGSEGERRKSLSTNYLKGLNYLLNEQPDKAIDLFIEVLEVDQDTIETHFALGSLFRRRGEVDRAIHIHQNLIARPALSQEQRAMALLALAEDYMRAGLFDRAENLFLELLELNRHTLAALRHLIDIYQQEKDWQKAITMAQRLEREGGREQQSLIALYHCELAELALESDETDEADNHIAAALSNHPDCVRASLLEGGIALEKGQWERARTAYERVERQDPAYLPLTLEPLERCYWRLGRSSEYRNYLEEVMERQPCTSVMMALAVQIRRERGEREAASFIVAQLRNHPTVRGLDELIDLHLTGSEGSEREHLLTLKELTRRLLEDRPLSRCNHCGFPARKIHWQCPGCKKWGTVRPLEDDQQGS